MRTRLVMISIGVFTLLALALVWRSPRVRHPNETGAAPEGSNVPAPEKSVSCQECTQNRCSELLTPCDAVDGNAGEGPAAGAPRKQLCERMLDCTKKTNCAVGVMTGCYCGKANLAECRGGGGNGACRSAFEEAFEATDPATVMTRIDSLALGGGAAGRLLVCARDFCLPECAVKH